MKTRFSPCGPFVAVVLAAAASAPAQQPQSAGLPKGAVFSGIESFSERYGPDFTIRMNEATGFARLLFGRPIPPPARAPESDGEFELLARAMVSENVSLFGVQSEDLVLDQVSHSPLQWIGTTDKIGVEFHQRASELRVRGAHLVVLFLADGTITGIDADVWPDAVLVDPTPALTAAYAAQLASADFNQRHAIAGGAEGAPELWIEPHLTNGHADSRLAWIIVVSANLRTPTPIRERLAIDAHSGEVLMEENLIHSADIIGTLQGWATPGTKPDTGSNPETVIGISRDTVSASGVGTTTTDTSGNFTFTGVSPGTYTVSAVFNGPYCYVQNSAGSEASVSGSFTTGVPGTLTFNTGKTEDRTAEVNAYKWVLSMRDWILSVDPTWDLMGFKVTANVNIASTCNAYYDGSSINFYASGGGCVNTAYSTVVCHENGHWANDLAGSGNGGDGFGEGGADVWAIYQTDQAIVGEDFCGTGCNIRTGENTRQFCGDCCGGCYGEVHADGEVLMGAIWKVRKRLDTSLGDAAGDAVADALMVQWFKQFDDGQIKTFVRDHWLMLDDDDGNIDNGTPHFTDIDSGFHDQGFPNYVKKPISIIHTPLGDTTDTIGPYVVVATITANIGNTINATELYYDVGAGFVLTPMSPTGNPSEYAGNIPGQPAPKVVKYYIRAADNLGNAVTSPSGAPASHYRFGVGNLDDIFFFDNFETSGDNGWTHSGTGQDDWQHGNPATSAYAGDPDNAYSGTKVWGNDLSLTGGDGMYEANVNNQLTSPAINCTGKVGVHVQFARWLTVEQGIYDHAYVQVSNDGTNYTNVFANVDGSHTLDSSWSIQSYDISLYADNKPSVRVRFRLQSDGGLEFGGWNVDDFKLVALTGGGDTLPPDAPSSLASPDHSVGVWSTNPTVTVTWAAPNDPGGSGIDGYSVLWDHTANTTPDTVKDIEESPLSYVQTLSNSSSGWYFHIRARDNAGNWGSAAHFGPVLIDTQAPSGTIAINNGAPTTASLLVTLNLSATDGESGMGSGAKMQFSNDGVTFSAEEAYASVKNNWDLSLFGGNADPGTKTVYARFRDAAGNLSGSVTDSIDYTPVPTVLSITPDNGPFGGGTAVTVDGTGFTPSATVKFGTQSSTSVTYVSSTQLIAVAPAYAGSLLASFAARVDVTVTTSGGSGVLPRAFAYHR